MERCYCCCHQHERCNNFVPSWSTRGQLSLAIQNCNKMWVKSLLAFPDKDFDIRKGSYMCQASEKGDVGILVELLAAGADTNEKSLNCEKRPLHICAEYGHLDALATLLNYGADIDQLDAHKRTAMHFASQQGHDSLIQVHVCLDLFLKLPEVLECCP